MRTDEELQNLYPVPCVNTDRELWREREGDYYADSIHVTEGGGIGMNCGGMVIVKTIREWHALAESAPAKPNESVRGSDNATPK